MPLNPYEKIVCKRCGGVKLIGVPCIHCKFKGLDYQGRQPILESTAALLRARRAKDSRDMRWKALIKTVKGKIRFSKMNRRRYQSARYNTLMQQNNALKELLALFEMFPDGAYGIYQDRVYDEHGVPLDSVQLLIRKAHIIVDLGAKLIKKTSRQAQGKPR